MRLLNLVVNGNLRSLFLVTIIDSNFRRNGNTKITGKITVICLYFSEIYFQAQRKFLSFYTNAVTVKIL